MPGTGGRCCSASGAPMGVCGTLPFRWVSCLDRDSIPNAQPPLKLLDMLFKYNCCLDGAPCSALSLLKFEAAEGVSLCGSVGRTFAERDDCSTLAGSGQGLSA